MDSQCIEHLEVVEAATGELEGSLFHFIDHCQSKLVNQQSFTMKLSNQAITALALASAFLPAAFARRRDEDVDVKSCHQIRRMLTSAVNISTSGGSINVAR